MNSTSSAEKLTSRVMRFQPGFSWEDVPVQEYKQKAVHYPDHPLYPEFIAVIRDPVFRDKRVWHDFDYPGVENLSSKEARERLGEHRSIDGAAELERLRGVA